MTCVITPGEHFSLQDLCWGDSLDIEVDKVHLQDR